jgi:hypothetical protein
VEHDANPRSPSTIFRSSAGGGAGEHVAEHQVLTAISRAVQKMIVNCIVQATPMTATCADIARLVTLVRLRYGMVEAVRVSVAALGFLDVFLRLVSRRRVAWFSTQGMGVLPCRGLLRICGCTRRDLKRVLCGFPRNRYLTKTPCDRFWVMS